MRVFGYKHKDTSVLNKYECRWCGYEFKHWVTTSGGEPKSSVSTQVKCPLCHNFLKNEEE